MELIITNRSRAYPNGQMQKHQVKDVRERDESMFGFEGTRYFQKKPFWFPLTPHDGEHVFLDSSVGRARGC